MDICHCIQLFHVNKVSKNIKNSSIKNINFFINVCVRKCSFPIKFFDGTSDKSFALQKLSDDDNLNAMKSVDQSYLSNLVET